MFDRTYDDPPPRQDRYPLSAYRVKTRKPVQVVVACRWYFGFFTHYVDERNVGCPGSDRCKECLENSQKRWNGAIGVTDTKGHNPRLLLFTPEAAAAFKEANQENEGLYRCSFTLWRETWDKRSKLFAQFEGLYRGEYPLMSQEYIVDNVTRIFKPGLLLNHRIASGLEAEA